MCGFRRKEGTIPLHLLLSQRLQADGEHPPFRGAREVVFVAVNVLDAKTSGGPRAVSVRGSERHLVGQARHREEDVGLELGRDESAPPNDDGGLGVGGIVSLRVVDLCEKDSFSAGTSEPAVSRGARSGVASESRNTSAEASSIRVASCTTKQLAPESMSARWCRLRG